MFVDYVRLIAQNVKNVADLFCSNSGVSHLHAAHRIDDVSRGSVSGPEIVQLVYRKKASGYRLELSSLVVWATKVALAAICLVFPALVQYYKRLKGVVVVVVVVVLVGVGVIGVYHK